MESIFLLFTISILAASITYIFLFFNKKPPKPKYALIDFWQNRYQKTFHQEWYLQPSDLLLMIRRFLKSKQMIILDIGTGNSMLTDHLYNQGFQYVIGVDFSSNVIEQMKHKFKNIRFVECDFTEFQARLPKETFHIVIDKAGSDSLIYGKTEKDEKTAKLVDSLYHVLVPKGQ